MTAPRRRVGSVGLVLGAAGLVLGLTAAGCSSDTDGDGTAGDADTRVFETVTADLALDGTVEQAVRHTRTEQLRGTDVRVDEQVDAVDGDELPLTVQVRALSEGEPVDLDALPDHHGPVTLQLQVRNDSAEPHQIEYGTPDGTVSETVSVPLPLVADVALELGGGWRQVTTDAGAVSAAADGGTHVRWRTEVFEPFGSATVDLTLEAETVGAPPPTLQVVAHPVTSASSPLLAAAEDLLTDRATIDAIGAVIAAGLAEGVLGAADGAEQLAAGLGALQEGVDGALDEFDVPDLDELFADGFGDLEELLADLFPDPDELLPDLEELVDDLAPELEGLFDDILADLDGQLAGLFPDPEALFADLFPDPEAILEELVADVLGQLDLETVLAELSEQLPGFEELLPDLDVDALRELLGLPDLDVDPDALGVPLELVGLVLAGLGEKTAMLEGLLDALAERLDGRDVPLPPPGAGGVVVEELADRLLATAVVLREVEGPTRLLEKLDDTRERVEAVEDALAEAEEELGPEKAHVLAPVRSAVADLGGSLTDARELAAGLHDELSAELAELADLLEGISEELTELAAELPVPEEEPPTERPEDLTDLLEELSVGLEELRQGLAGFAELVAVLAGLAADGSLDDLGVEAILGELLTPPDLDELLAGLDAAALLPDLDLDPGAFLPDLEPDALLPDLDPSSLLPGGGVAAFLREQTQLFGQLEGLLPDLDDVAPDPDELDPAALAPDLDLGMLDDFDDQLDELVEGIGELGAGADALVEGLEEIAEEGLGELVAQLDDDNRDAQRDLALLRALDQRAAEAGLPTGTDGVVAHVRYELASAPDRPLTAPAVGLVVLLLAAGGTELLRRRWTA